MEHRFKLHAHEVWREKLVREGVYDQRSGDLRRVLPPGVWDDSRFVFGPYTALGSTTREIIGHILFRPENGADEENFFVCERFRGAEEPLCRPANFYFEQTEEESVLRFALSESRWGRVFYLDEDGLRRDNQLPPCDWGVFLCANGLGAWKWTMRDGVSWDKAGDDGVFRWHHNRTEATRFLARATSFDAWSEVQKQMRDSSSEMAFAKRWIQLDEEERLDEVVQWKCGSRKEWQTVLRWLLLADPALLEANVIELFAPVTDVDGGIATLSCDEEEWDLPPFLSGGLDVLEHHFSPKWKPILTSTAKERAVDPTILLRLENPTHHERLEAHQQLQTWATQRGLSFD